MISCKRSDPPTCIFCGEPKIWWTAAGMWTCLNIVGHRLEMQKTAERMNRRRCSFNNTRRAVMKLTTILACLFMFACVEADVAMIDQEVGTGTTAGNAACWSPSTPSATCTVPTLQSGTPWAGATRCGWSASSGFSGFCHTGAIAGYSETNCDGPEDCFSGMTCCMHATGGVFKSVCQSGQCNQSEPTYDPNHLELCHSGADCWPWRQCLPSGAPNHTGLPQGLGICK